MKNILLTFFFAVAVIGLSAQVKVETTGNTIVGGGTAGNANLKSTGSSELELAINAIAGNTDFTYQVSGDNKGQIKYINSNPGITYNLDQNFTGTLGIPDSKTALFLSASNQRVGVGNLNPSTKLHVSGTITYAGGSIGSDKRLKRDIKPFEAGLDEVLAIQPKTYFYNGKADITTTDKQVGVIAQDFQKISPESVHTFTHQTWESDETGENTRLVNQEEYLRVNTGDIQYMLVNAIKEQQQLITDLQLQIDALRNEESNDYSVHFENEENAALSQNYPNPATDRSTIYFQLQNQDQNASINVFDMSGKLISKLNVAGKNGKIDLDTQALPSGQYLYNLEIDGKVVDTKKLIIAK